ncbi:hypothetical protein [Halorubrum halophilum]|uniref:hypothetical protein n=1 Tax=Halorubrum halophilum TaxID=413816 RepID=UPI00186AFF8D|nr:hypothetical protein [Halorubrum halophilum]
MALDRSSVKSILMVFMIVSSSLLAPVGGAAADEFRTPASSDTSPEAGECSNLDDFIMFLSVGRINADSCSRQAYVDAAVSDMKESDANQSKVDIYSAAAGAKATREAGVAPFDNYLQDTESIAWMKAESAIATAYQNDKSKAEAKIAAREAIAGYYHTKQANLVEQWNVSVSQADTLQQQAAMEDGISEYYIRAAQSGGGSHYNQEFEGVNGNTTLTSVADRPIGALTIGLRGDGYNGWSSTTIDPTSGQWEYNRNTGSSPNMVDMYGIRVKAPNSNYDDMTYMEFDPFKERWNNIESQNSALQSEADAFVEATWSDYDSGQINASDVLSANTAMSEYGVRSANESEGLWRSTAALSMMGYDTPNLNNSGMMTVEYRNSNHTGLLMARNAPNGTWEVNTTYNTSDIDGPVFMTKTDGTKLDFADGEEFTIVGMTAKDGTAVNSTQTTKYRYKTANTTELLEVQNQLMDLRQEIEDREPEAGGFFGTGSTDTMLVGLLALAGALLMMQNQNRGGRR